MPLPVPKPYPWYAGTPIVQASDLNTGLRDSFNFLTSKCVFRGRQTAAQSIANNTWTAINLSSGGIDVDNYSGWSSGSPSRYTAQINGTYLVTGTVWMSGTATANATGIAGIGVNQASNGAVWVSCEMEPDNDSNAWAVPAGWLTYLGVGDYVALHVFQSTGGALNTFISGGASFEPQMDVYWISS